jgi:hypothetical protein
MVRSYAPVQRAILSGPGAALVQLVVAQLLSRCMVPVPGIARVSDKERENKYHTDPIPRASFDHL